MVKSMNKLMLAFALAACMGFCALAGCGSDSGGESDAPVDSGQAANAVTADASASEAGIPNLDWLLSQDAQTVYATFDELAEIIVGGMAGDSYCYANDSNYLQVARGSNESAAEWLELAENSYVGIWALRIGPAGETDPASSVDDLVAGEYALGSVTLEWVTDLPDPTQEAVLAKLNGVADFSGAAVSEQPMAGDSSHMRFIVNDFPNGSPSAEVVTAGGKALIRVYVGAAA